MRYPTSAFLNDCNIHLATGYQSDDEARGSESSN
jgi:hypothetical protein